MHNLSICAAMQKLHDRYLYLAKFRKKKHLLLVVLFVIKSTMAGLEPTLPKEFDSTKQGIRVKRSNHFATLPTMSAHYKHSI